MVPRVSTDILFKILKHYSSRKTFHYHLSTCRQFVLLGKLTSSILLIISMFLKVPSLVQYHSLCVFLIHPHWIKLINLYHLPATMIQFRQRSSVCWLDNVTSDIFLLKSKPVLTSCPEILRVNFVKIYLFKNKFYNVTEFY